MARKIEITEEDYFDLRETADELAALAEDMPQGVVVETIGKARGILDNLLYSYEGAWEDEEQV